MLSNMIAWELQACPALTTNELTVTHVLLLVLGLLERVRLSVSHHDPGVGDVSG